VTQNELTFVLLTWTAPFDNYMAITGYQTQVLSKSDGQYYDVCLLKSQEFECRIQMHTLRDSFGYQFQDLVQFRTRAINSRGYSAWSELNTAGALVQTEPTKMQAPTRNLTPD
jgi:hypothetical protein